MAHSLRTLSTGWRRPRTRLLAALAAIALAGCAATQQTREEVALRPAGSRQLEAPVPAGPQARLDWERAWIAEAAYDRAPPTSSDCLPERLTPDQVLAAAGWTEWPASFLPAEVAQRIQQSHLRVDVWEKDAPPTVVVAFGGTVFTSGKDWTSNLRWFIPGHRDEYTTLVGDFAPAFVAEFKRRAAAGGVAARARLEATGHSLGGGLAQHFAYALPPDPAVRRVDQVYAFDSSPVTGYFTLPQALREENARQLVIERVYERGELLALLRSLAAFVVPPTQERPAITGVRYSTFSGNPVSNHSIYELACHLQKLAR